MVKGNRKRKRKSATEGTPPNQRSIRSYFTTGRDGVQEPCHANSQGAAATRSDRAPENGSSFPPEAKRPHLEKATNSKGASARGELKSSTQSTAVRVHEADFQQQEDQASKKRGREEVESEEQKKKKKTAGLHSREEIEFLAHVLRILGYKEENDEILHEMHLCIKRGDKLMNSDMVLVVDGRKFCVEYDGEYWHSLDNSPERDVTKTKSVLQLDREVHVIRVRQGNLPPLHALEGLDRCTILASGQKKTFELAHQTCDFIRKYILFTAFIHSIL